MAMLKYLFKEKFIGKYIWIKSFFFFLNSLKKFLCIYIFSWEKYESYGLDFGENKSIF